MGIKIYSDTTKGCIFFDNSRVEPKFIGTIVASAKPDEPNRLIIKRTDKFLADGTTFRTLFKRLKANRVENQAGENLVNDLGYSRDDVVNYINQEANDFQVISSTTVGADVAVDFALDATNTTILMSNGASFAVNSIRAAASDDGLTIKIVAHASDVVHYDTIDHEDVTINGADTSGSVSEVVNLLNALFAQTGSPTGNPPVITSATTVNINRGDTLNYELTATDGVGYQWSNLPSGVVTVDGDVRKLIGGSELATGSYEVTAKAVNYFGSDENTINIVVSEPPFANTKSIKFTTQDYMGANAALLDPVLGRSGSGSGSSDAWSISFWVKPTTHQNVLQSVFYYGAASHANDGVLAIRYHGGNDKINLFYGTQYNNLSMYSPNDSVPAGQWSHVMITYNGTSTGSNSTNVNNYYNKFKFYVNGLEVTKTNAHSNYGYNGSISGQNLRIGRFTSGNWLRDGFKVEEVAVWGSNQGSNISSIYNGGNTHDLSLLSTAPDHWWRMGDGDTYPTIQDNVGTAHFVMYNMTAADIVTDAP